MDILRANGNSGNKLGGEKLGYLAAKKKKTKNLC
jgi:hypothetical protein